MASSKFLNTAEQRILAPAICAFMAAVTCLPFPAWRAGAESIVNPTEVIEGQIIEGGVTCQLFKTTDGRTFALDGMNVDLPIDGRILRVEGIPVGVSTCQQGDAFHVVTILGEADGAPRGN